jgi:hypothetical protein
MMFRRHPSAPARQAWSTPLTTALSPGEQQVRTVIEDQFHRARKHDIEIDRVRMVHGERRTRGVLDSGPAHRTRRDRQVEEVGNAPAATIDRRCGRRRVEDRIEDAAQAGVPLQGDGCVPGGARTPGGVNAGDQQAHAQRL